MKEDMMIMGAENYRTIPIVVTREFFNSPKGESFGRQEWGREKELQEIPYDEFKNAYNKIISVIGEVVAEQQTYIEVEKITFTLELTVSAETFKLGLSTTAGMTVELKPKNKE